MNRRHFSRALLAVGAGAVAAAQEERKPTGQQQDSSVGSNPKSILLEASPTAVVRRDPQSNAVMSLGVVAFSENTSHASLGRLYSSPTISNEDFIEGNFDEAYDLPVPISGAPDFGDLHELADGESIDIVVNFTGEALRPVERGGFLTLAVAAATPSPVKIGSLVISFEKRTDIDPPCLTGTNRLTGARMKFDIKSWLGTNRLFSAYLSMSGSKRFLHGEIDLWLTKVKWCWTFNSIWAELLRYAVALLSKALDAAGFSQTAASVNNTANALLKALRQLVPGLIP